MDSLDFFEEPKKLLDHEGRRRKAVLILLSVSWFLLMTSLVGGAYCMKTHQEKRLVLVRDELSKMQPRIAQVQHLEQQLRAQEKSQCAAYRLKALFASPIRGLHLASVQGADTWAINGSSDHPQAMEAFKQLIEEQLEQTEWVEQFTEGLLSFRVEGSLAC